MKTIMVHLPFHFTLRNFVYTPVLNEMGKHEDYRFVLITPKLADKDAIENAGHSNISHELIVPRSNSPANKYFKPNNLLSRLALPYWARFDAAYLQDTLIYRYNHIQKLANLRIRRSMSPQQQQLEMIYSNFVPDKIGGPFTGSKWLYRQLFKLRFSSWVPTRDAWLEALFEHYQPDVLVMSRLQYPTVPPFLRAARTRSIPIIGLIQSWDQPTTKGPIPPGSNVFVVGSDTMVDEMPRYHRIPKSRVVNTGHTFLDNYHTDGFIDTRPAFMKELGLSPDRKLIVLCTNLETMKAHEPSIARHIAQGVKAGRFGANATLYIRAHLQDKTWKKDFYDLNDPPNVVVARACGFGYIPEEDRTMDPWQDMRFLANLMKHGDVIINTRGTITLDAIAQDSPAICLGFDGDLELPESDRVIRRYEFEHFKPVVDAGGTWLVRSYEELDEAIDTYIKNPDHHTEGRARVRAEHLEPFDGQSSKRLVDLMTRFASGDIPETQRKGFWSHQGY